MMSSSDVGAERGCKRVKTGDHQQEELDGGLDDSEVICLERCPECGQFLENAIKFHGDSRDYVSEDEVINDDKIIQYQSSDASALPEVRITNYTIFCKLGHLCVIEEASWTNQSHYICGFVDTKDVWDLSFALIGPIQILQLKLNSTGLKLTITTAKLRLYLTDPSIIYQPYQATVRRNKHVKELFIETVKENPDRSLDECINQIETHLEITENAKINHFDQEIFIENSQAIIEQLITSHDEKTGYEEGSVDLQSQAIQELLNLSGPCISDEQRAIVSRRQVQNEPEKARATTTALVAEAFEDVFASQMVVWNQNTPGLNNADALVQTQLGAGPVVFNIPVNYKATVKWCGTSVECINEDLYFNAVYINDEKFEIGDFCLVKPNGQLYKKRVGETTRYHTAPVGIFFFAQILYLFEDSTGNRKVHVKWFDHSKFTLLEESGRPNELFATNDCDDIFLSNCLSQRINITYKSPGHPHKTRSFDYYYQFKYDRNFARFEDVVEPENNSPFTCPLCEQKQRLNILPIGEINSFITSIYYESVRFNDVMYNVGDFVFFPPKSYQTSHGCKAEDPAKNKYVPSDEYPELRRLQTSSHVKGSNTEVPPPLRVRRIEQVYCASGLDEVQVILRKFYRPEDTHLPREETDLMDVNLLYWSEDVENELFKRCLGKCQAVYCDPSHASRDQDTFYYSEMFDGKTRRIQDLPSHAKSVEGESGDGRQSKLPVHSGFKPMSSFEIFCGAGGSSEGFHQAGLAEVKWAIDSWKVAARSFKSNFPDAIVFSKDCNDILKYLIEGRTVTPDGQRLPKRGEVDLLCGGPPCQGFSLLNRFSNSDKYKLKNSLVATYLSFCDHLRPRIFFMENVVNLTAKENGVILKLTLRSLLDMGYQCTADNLQAGHFGVPQNRRRLIVLAAQHGKMLANFPMPTHTFIMNRATDLTLKIGDKKFTTFHQRKLSAPFRMVTIRDAMSDLPHISQDKQEEEMQYPGETLTHFQRNVRCNSKTGQLTDHICKECRDIVNLRFKLIPKIEGANWQYLPNREVPYGENKKTKKLSYMFPAKKGDFKGVCPCIGGDDGKCAYPAPGEESLIPWPMAHRAHKNDFSSCYGRLSWNGYFNTTITSPDPAGKQGLVIHPEQDRIVSIRECARSQGFPDSYIIEGTTSQKYQQIGNAVPPPMTKAIGREILKNLLNGYIYI